MTYTEESVKLNGIIENAGNFQTLSGIGEAVNIAVNLEISSEIIGTWLYCFTTPFIGFLLERLGFWFSFKHRAYIYTGRPKDGAADDESLDEIRARHGCQIVKEVLF